MSDLRLISRGNERPMRRAAVLACVSLCIALPAAGCGGGDGDTGTIRVVTSLVDESRKGGRVIGTEVLWNDDEPQFGKPQDARVGIDRYVYEALDSGKVAADVVFKLPGGSLHARGIATAGPGASVPIVGGTGLYAGATGVMDGEVISERVARLVFHVRLP